MRLIIIYNRWHIAVSAPSSLPSDRVSTLYHDHHQWLRGWLRRRLGCHDKAADLAHDTFIRLLTGNGSALELNEPRAFLTTLANRVLSNHWRREKLESAYLAAARQLPAQTAPSPEERAIVLETLLELDRLLDGLSAVVRRAFLMTQLDGLTHAQVAAALNISETSVKRYVVKALQRLCFAELGTP